MAAPKQGLRWQIKPYTDREVQVHIRALPRKKETCESFDHQPTEEREPNLAETPYCLGEDFVTTVLCELNWFSIIYVVSR
jgi:hypothetical protein